MSQSNDKNKIPDTRILYNNLLLASAYTAENNVESTV